jgi:hypothetical protein
MENRLRTSRSALWSSILKRSGSCCSTIRKRASFRMNCAMPDLICVASMTSGVSPVGMRRGSKR